MKFQLKKAMVLVGLFLALFFAGFYVVNVLNIKPTAKPIIQFRSNQNIAISEELKKRIGDDGVNLAQFEDWAKINGIEVKDYDGDADGDGLPNFLEYIHGTDPKNKDTDGDKYSDKQEIINGFDPDAPGEAKPLVVVEIEKLKVNAPMIWTQSEAEKDSLKDLESGLSHFPKSAAPGENGSVIISGHSSNYIWAKGDYNYIFKDLNNLENGDVVKFKIVQKNGRIINYKYKVSDKFITTPDDEKIFQTTTKPTLTLSTCWPLGTNFKRLIVKADLVK